MAIYYVYDKRTGAFAGSGITPIRTTSHNCTTTPPDDAMAQREEERVWQWKDGRWNRALAKDVEAAPAAGGHR